MRSIVGLYGKSEWTLDFPTGEPGLGFTGEIPFYRAEPVLREKLCKIDDSRIEWTMVFTVFPTGEPGLGFTGEIPCALAGYLIGWVCMHPRLGRYAPHQRIYASSPG